jgi:transposase
MNNCKLVLGRPEDNQKFSWATSTLLWVALCTTKRKSLKPNPVCYLFQLHKIKRTYNYTILSSGSQASTILSFIEARRVVYSHTKTQRSKLLLVERII